MTKHCHKLIRKTAKEMAHEVYSDVMKHNGSYAQWKALCPELTPKLAEDKFVEHLWPHLINDARTTLARMLGMNYPEALKAEIHEALVLDASLRRGRTPLPRQRITLQ